MPVINAAPTADTYPDSTGATLPILARVYNSRGGWFSVTGAAVFCEMEYGPQGSSYWTAEVELGAGAFAYLDKACTGVRFRSAVSGAPATITAQIAQGPEPPLSIIALGSISTTGIAPTRTILTVGAGTYTPPPGALALLFEGVAGGGGGGGVSVASAGQVATAGGGGGGAYSAALVQSPLAVSYAYVVGGGGAGGPAGANNGTAGTDTSVAGVLLAKAGGFGSGAANVAAPSFATGGAGGSAAAGTGTVKVDGGGGGYGFSPFANSVGAGGWGGGGAVYGAQLAPTQSIAAGGNPGTQYGGGGGGAVRTSSTGTHKGGDGTAGVIIVTEFY